MQPRSKGDKVNQRLESSSSRFYPAFFTRFLCNIPKTHGIFLFIYRVSTTTPVPKEAGAFVQFCLSRLILWLTLCPPHHTALRSLLPAISPRFAFHHPAASPQTTARPVIDWDTPKATGSASPMYFPNRRGRRCASPCQPGTLDRARCGPSIQIAGGLAHQRPPHYPANGLHRFCPAVRIGEPFSPTLVVAFSLALSIVVGYWKA